MNTIIGIDVGSTNTKAFLFDMQGNVLRSASRKTIAHKPISGIGVAEYDPEELWQNVSACLREISEGGACDQVQSIGVSSFGEASVLLDGQGEAVYPIISWFDLRATDACDVLVDALGMHKIYEITGHFANPKFGLTKLMWIKQHAPEAFARARHCLTVHDYITFRLTGAYTTDYSLATRLLCFDIHTCDWSDTMLEASGVPRDLFAPAHPGGTLIGGLQASAATQTGLKAGIPVSMGGHDHSCAAIGVNIFEDNVALDSLGTAEANIVALEKPFDDFAMGYAGGLCIYPHCGRKKYRVITSMQACAVNMEWFVDKFGVDPDHLADDVENMYDKLMREAEIAAARGSGLLYFPHMRGMQENALQRGTFVGVDDACDHAQMINAILEGLCYENQVRLSRCEQALGMRFDTLRTVGGLSVSRPQMQRKADVTGRRIEIPRCGEAAGYGAALLGAIGAGVMREEDLAHTYGTSAIYTPGDATVRAPYLEKYARYNRLYDTVMALY
nr:FGGY-family carbohydrate kinase [Maliibacterium massiliense]